MLFDWVVNIILKFAFGLQIALGYLISKIGKVVIIKILPLFVRIFRCSEMLSVCADTLCEYETALWIFQMTNYSFKRINAGRHILIFYINIWSGKMYTTGINYTKNGIAGEKAWHNKTWVGSYYHRVVVSPLPYLGYII